MRQGLLCALLLAAACNATNPNAAVGEFFSPTGIGATGAADRDLVFIANTGRDGLRALQLCNKALPDGGVDPADTCPSDQDRQFIPAPIRVFAATIETGDRPLRVAGVRLSRADGSAAGVALAAGADSTVALVDARSLVESVQNPSSTPRPIERLDVGDRTVDVVASNPIDGRDLEVAASAGSTVTAFVATESELVVLDVGLDSGGLPQLPAIRSRCTLAPVKPVQLGLVPGSDAQVYVADGAGDGVVSIATASIAGGSCTTDRIGAGGRSVRSISLSPRWFDAQGVTHPAGELLLMVLEPLDTPQAGQDLDPGGVLFAETGIAGGPKGIVPTPPFGLTETTQEPMQPLTLAGAGFIREGAFLRAVQPRPTPAAPDLATCTGSPCTPLYVGQPTNAPVHSFELLAAATATDGSTYFIEVPLRRFVNQNLYSLGGELGLVPTVDLAPAFSPATGNALVLNLDTTRFEPGPDFTAGLTRKAFWRALWHSPIPGLERRGGTVTPNPGLGTLTFKSQADFTLWQNDPAIAFGVGDVVSFGAYTLPADASAACAAVVNSETAYRFELPVVAIPSADTLELAELADNGDVRGFRPDDCASFGAVAEIRTGGTQPWLVFSSSAAFAAAATVSGTVRGRVQPDGTFVVHERRFDYPRLQYDSANPPVRANNVSFTFAISGPDPTTVTGLSGFNWTIGSGQLPLSYGDSGVLSGFATAVYAYSSSRHQNLVFTSVTGSNEVIQADPAVLNSTSTGLVLYR